MHVLFNY